MNTVLNNRVAIFVKINSLGINLQIQRRKHYRACRGGRGWLEAGKSWKAPSWPGRHPAALSVLRPSSLVSACTPEPVIVFLSANPGAPKHCKGQSHHGFV